MKSETILQAIIQLKKEAKQIKDIREALQEALYDIEEAREEEKARDKQEAQFDAWQEEEAISRSEARQDAINENFEG